MLKHPRHRLLAAVTGEGGWIHPYTDPFTCYRDGGGDNGDGKGDNGDGDADGDGDDGDQDDDSDDGDGDDDDDDDKDGDDDKLGAKGIKALREVRRENRRLKAQLRERGDGDTSGRKTSAKDGKGDKGDKDGDQDDAESIREQARQDARAEVWNERVEAAAIAEAAGRLANPSRVAALLGEDLADIPKDAKGRPDKEAISELIDDLLDTDPYLAVPAKGDTGRRFQGDADSGARKKTKKSAGSLDEAIAAKFAGKTGG
ncbi:hypothetical protein ACIOKD_14260 [Streptomyces sp. NPDC087844]|uniref:hypothetical protein n=1 Tax=Streptomyces sp. NPDC087844 TaxID=3365805 RepID=UPI0038256D86